MPFIEDQPFWGSGVFAVGAGPNPIPVKCLSVDKLTCAIMEADTNRIRERALLIGQRIGNEDGIKEAMKLIEGHTSEFKTNVDSVF
jgi:sterol 3beta-glucosyltransferase